MIIITLITIVSISVIVWAAIKLAEKIYNIIVLSHASKNPNPDKQHHGLTYNKKTKKLEGNNSTITPF
jgi:hypothetical protein